MTWREFHLRRIGWEREEKRSWYHTREIAYNALIGGNIDPKKLSKEKYMPLDESNQSKGGMTDQMKSALALAREKAQKELINGSRP